MVMAPAAAITTDPETFYKANAFDSHRYHRMYENHRDSVSLLVLVMSTIDLLGFGLGNQAYPGRFLAINNLKLMLAKLLVGWDLKIAKDGRQYAGLLLTAEYNNFSVVPLEYSVLMRKL